MFRINKSDLLHKWIQISVIVHVLLIFAVISINNSIPASRVIQIDFLMEDTIGISTKNPEPAFKHKKQEMARPIQKKEVLNPPVKEEVVQSTAVSSDVSEDRTPLTAPDLHHESHDTLSPVNDVLSARAKPASVGNSAESVQQRYLKEHFNYIRDLIQKKLTYPKIARKMGWSGKVVVSFMVCTDGKVKDIKISEGSGFEILDNNTIQIVKKISPFPRPPVEAQLLIPVTYNLN